jgi:hypothetical protein
MQLVGGRTGLPTASRRPRCRLRASPVRGSLGGSGEDWPPPSQRPITAKRYAAAEHLQILRWDCISRGGCPEPSVCVRRTHWRSSRLSKHRRTPQHVPDVGHVPTPARAVRTPRVFRALAKPRRSVSPFPRNNSTIGRRLAANASASLVSVRRPRAAASFALRRLPSLAPLAFRAARVAFVSLRSFSASAAYRCSMNGSARWRPASA